MIDKIRKLFALASNNPNQAEADAALAKAMRMMAEQGISEDEVKETKSPIINGDLLGEEAYDLSIMGNAAAKLMGTLFVKYGALGYRFVGRADNVEASVETLKYMMAELERHYKLALPKGLTQKERANFRREFKYTFSLRILQRVGDVISAMASESSTGSALVIHTGNLQDEVREHMSDSLKTSKARPRRLTNAQAVGSAKVAADQVQLRKEVK